MKTIPLTRGLFAVVDDEDFEELSRFKWQAVPYGTNIYASRHTKTADGRNSTLLMHRHLLGLAAGESCVDHVDGCGLNNVRSNLRVVSKRENAWNRTRKQSGRASSRFKGVSRAGSKWRVRITCDGRTVALGTFGTEDEAAAAYERAAVSMFGEYARQVEAAE